MAHGAHDPINRPPPGWVSENGVVQASELVTAYAARFQTVKGVCRARGCTRRVELDPKSLCGDGLALISMSQVQSLWRCQRLDGCGLIFHKEKALRPLTLGQFIGKPNVRVRIRCRGHGCKFFRVWRVEEMIAGLQKREQGGDRTDIDELGAKMTTACPMCKRVNWIADMLWVNTETMGWKALGERSFQARET